MHASNMSVSSNNNSSSDNDDPWAITIKAVGNAAFDFVVNVSPNDDLQVLNDAIRKVTGLKSNQQRLIYRGRILGDGPKKLVAPTKVKDVNGLADGHTIHLVRKRLESDRDDNNDDNTNINLRGSASSSHNSDDTSESPALSSDSESTATSLLNAILSEDLFETPATNTPRETTSTTNTPTRRLYTRSGSSRRARTNHRLTAEDVEVSNPGSLEGVRQGMLTLHTLLPAAQTADQRTSPLSAPRQWYRGQWIDCLDTVQQWLEATIVDIVSPEEILTREEIENVSPESQDNTTTEVNDPTVFSGDLAGRRHLLLENDGEGGYRSRRTNYSVNLLLIHYNGWRHSWDEWIRSDSDRIRPFRSRTRHPDTQATPTTQSAFLESPSTRICSASDDNEDRAALLSELHHLMTNVTNLLGQAASNTRSENSSNEKPSPHLPWGSQHQDNSNDGDETNIATANILANHDSVRMDTHNEEKESECNESNVSALSRRRQLEALAPLLDRLGRTLTDAAPQVAYLASTIPVQSQDQSSSSSEDASMTDAHMPLEGLLSILGQNYRRNQSSASTNVVVGDSVATSVDNTSSSTQEAAEEYQPVDPDHTDYASGFVNTTRGHVRTGPRTRLAQATGESGSSGGSDLAGMLGAYIAAASLGLNTSGDSEDGGNNSRGLQGLSQLLSRTGESGGIDIHIHATMVTSPGGGGFAVIGGGGGGGNTTTTNAESTSRDNETSEGTSSSTNAEYSVPAWRNFARAIGNRNRGRNNDTGSRVVSNQFSEDDLGIFDDLYSENPDSIDPSAPVITSSNSTASSDSTTLHLFDAEPTSSNEYTDALTSVPHMTTTPDRASSIGSSSALSPSPSSRRRMFSRLFRRNTPGQSES